MSTCEICGSYIFSWQSKRDHTCPPQYYCAYLGDLMYELNKPPQDPLIVDEYSHDVVYVGDHSDAAMEFMSNDDEFHVHDEDGTKVIVILADDVETDDDGRMVWPKDKYKIFTVSWYPVPSFSAIEETI